MEPAIVVALVAAGSSMAVAVWTFFSTRANQAALEQLRDRLGDQAASRQARRDYEYEAAKRLYHEIEPLRFGSIVAAESAYARVIDLARAARDGHLEPVTGWLDDESDPYFLKSTVYRLLAPLAWMRLAQAKLTLLDFSLDPELRAWYLLARQAMFSFSDDFALAQAPPALDYDPDDTAAPRNETIHVRQGVYIGLIEQAVDTLIADGDVGPRVVGFGTFLRCQEDSEHVRNALRPIFEFFRSFHPDRRPVAWRVLLAQALIHRVLPRAGDVRDTVRALVPSPDEIDQLASRPTTPDSAPGREPELDAVVHHLAGALTHAESLWARPATERHT